MKFIAVVLNKKAPETELDVTNGYLVSSLIADE